MSTSVRPNSRPVRIRGRTPPRFEHVARRVRSMPPFSGRSRLLSPCCRARDCCPFESLAGSMSPISGEQFGRVRVPHGSPETTRTLETLHRPRQTLARKLRRALRTSERARPRARRRSLVERLRASAQKEESGLAFTGPRPLIRRSWVHQGEPPLPPRTSANAFPSREHRQRSRISRIVSRPRASARPSCESPNCRALRFSGRARG
jgi:hypothetical protein